MAALVIDGSTIPCRAHLRITMKHARANKVADDLSLAYFDTAVAAVSVKIDANRTSQQSFSDLATYSLKLEKDILGDPLIPFVSLSNCVAASPYKGCKRKGRILVWVNHSHLPNLTLNSLPLTLLLWQRRARSRALFGT